jgi:spermidine/putrescine transport system substrate-binding protein
VYKRQLYDTAKAPAGDVSWSWIYDAKLVPFVFMDEQRSMLGITNMYLGHAMNTRAPAEVKASVDALIAAKGNPGCLGFDGGVGGKNKVLAGQAAAAVVYNGDAARAIEESTERKLNYVVPKEGSNIWVDCLLITKSAPNVAGAHAFINYVLDPAVAAQISNFNKYATPVAAAKPKITPEDAANLVIYPDAEKMKKLSFLEDLGKDTRLYTEAWTAVKSR